MVAFIQFLTMAFLLGFLWGIVFAFLFLKFSIKRGHLPKIFLNKKRELIALLKKSDQEGG